MALEAAIAAETGHAIVAFKAPASARAISTGRREAIPAATIAAGLDLLVLLGVTVVEYYSFMGAAHVQLPPGIATLLRDNPLIDYIEPRQWWTVQGSGIPLSVFVSADYSAQIIPWGVELVRAPEAWTVATGAGTRVQIIDTGHDRGHEDLPLVPLGNCAGPYNGCTDISWFPHGTHVLGTFTARHNSIGVVGVAPGVAASDVYSYAACTASSCSTDAIISGIQASIWFDVLNMSLGGEFDFGGSNAVAQAWAEGVVLIAAAGNRPHNVSPPANFYPAGYTNVIGVSGVRPDKSFASTSPCPWGNAQAASNFGWYVDIAAPFWALSTVANHGYEDESQGWCGTSMAAPHVAGAAALVRQQNPSWTNAQIRSRLFDTAEDLGSPGWDTHFGHGLLDAAYAVGIAPPQPPPPLNVMISGPLEILPGATCLWDALVFDGTPPYDYWWSGGIEPYGAFGPSFQGGKSPGVPGETFIIRVDVTDSGNRSGWTEILVTEDQNAEVCVM